MGLKKFSEQENLIAAVENGVPQKQLMQKLKKDGVEEAGVIELGEKHSQFS